MKIIRIQQENFLNNYRKTLMHSNKKVFKKTY